MRWNSPKCVGRGEGWQRDATRQLATGRTAEALGAYRQADMVHVHADPKAARAALAERWADARATEPGSSQVMLAYLRADVAELNRMARDRVREAGQLGVDQAVTTTRGVHDFAAGERVMFLRNVRSLGVKNGSLGEVSALWPGAMRVRLDDGRQVEVDLKTYADLDHGYATTIHKAQGVTVDRTHVLASSHMDRNATYAAMSRHRHSAVLHYDRENFPTERRLVQTLGRQRVKDTTLDYAAQFSDRRGIGDAHASGGERPDILANFRPSANAPTLDVGVNLNTATRDFARAWGAADEMRALDLPGLEQQSEALERAARALDAARPGLSEAMERQLRGDPQLAERARRGETRALLQGAEQDLLSGGIQGPVGLKQGPERERSLGQELPPPSRGRGRGGGWEL